MGITDFFQGSTSVKSFEVSEPLQASLKGFALANPGLTLIEKQDIVLRKTDKSKIALISGGGCGHEPTHAGFVGQGLLSAAVCGEIFASPSTKQILNAIKVLDKNSSGVLLIVKNYTGDVLHFGLAAERARALGIPTRVAVVGDDVAVGREKGGFVGRRALAGTVLVHKITGAFAEQYSEKYGLDGTARVAEIVNENLVTIGSSLDHCKVPGRKFETELNDKKMELGMGIHNEPGVRVLEPVPSVEELLEKDMLPKLLDPNDKDRHFVNFDKDDDVVLLVNNLGGVAPFMLTAIAGKTVEFLDKNYKIKPVQTITGTLMTSFNMDGFSITLLNASKASKKLHEEFSAVKCVRTLLNAPTDAPGWPRISYDKSEAPSIDEKLLQEDVKVKEAGTYDYDHFSKMMKSGADKLIKSEPYITELDSKVGDGDCGYTLVGGAKGITENLEKVDKKYLSQALAQISDIIESSMGGTSGGLYSIMISGLAQGIIQECKEKDTQVTPEILSNAFQHALETLYKYTKARPGSSTVIDALEPFVKEFSSSNDFSKAIEAAEKGAKSTGSIEAKFGRASYVSDSSEIPDPGAIGLVEFLKGVKEGY
ncbi:LAMI_0H01112g1_1 [Lachancea mirantina]|uniref:LAMI_0H01112g1_1 n=1 Tax=Lachancea mirantina TaxID=1230905 RepID=A0A1G4KDQ9_9SACH|nr:LAMI_0H01112g1_1 [Lachancea mirantina]